MSKQTEGYRLAADRDETKEIVAKLERLQREAAYSRRILAPDRLAHPTLQRPPLAWVIAEDQNSGERALFVAVRSRAFGKAGEERSRLVKVTTINERTSIEDLGSELRHFEQVAGRNVRAEDLLKHESKRLFNVPLPKLGTRQVSAREIVQGTAMIGFHAIYHFFGKNFYNPFITVGLIGTWALHHAARIAFGSAKLPKPPKWEAVQFGLAGSDARLFKSSDGLALQLQDLDPHNEPSLLPSSSVPSVPSVPSTYDDLSVRIQRLERQVQSLLNRSTRSKTTEEAREQLAVQLIPDSPAIRQLASELHAYQRGAHLQRVLVLPNEEKQPPLRHAWAIVRNKVTGDACLVVAVDAPSAHADTPVPRLVKLCDIHPGMQPADLASKIRAFENALDRDFTLAQLVERERQQQPSDAWTTVDQGLTADDGNLISERGDFDPLTLPLQADPEHDPTETHEQQVA